MYSLFLNCEPCAEDELIGELYAAGTAGIAEEPGGVRAFFEDEPMRDDLLRRFAAFQPVLREEAPADWEQITRDSFPPLLVGQRWFLTPPWCEDATPAGRIRLVINPGMACGTGWHPCTQLCLEALEDAVRSGGTVLDVGAGSGILSEAAKALGAARVWACDIDRDALLVARERVHVPMFTGSADAVRPGIADVVVANISSAAEEELSGELRRVARPGAVLIVSGFEADDLPDGYEGADTLTRDGWACLVCRHFAA